jgi:polysaccharide pyruvyl transferase WcaK-like protein
VLERLGRAVPVLHFIEPPDGAHERQRYDALLTHFGVAPAPQRRWLISDSWGREGAAFLRGHGLEEGRYIACFPGEAGSIKRWPEQRYVEVLDQAFETASLPALLIGTQDERNELERLSGMLGCARSAVFCGGSDELGTVAALLATSRAYLGNDTGLIHLAQAVGVPGVAIFGGGGQWPRYAPWQDGSVGLVHPLPCFGCDWDCVLGHALCVESVPASAVIGAMSEVLARNGNAPPRVLELDVVDPAAREVLADAAQTYRSAQHDRADRLDVIVDAEHRLSRHIAEARHRDADRAARIAELTSAVADRDVRLGVLEQASAERLALVEAIHHEAAERARVLEELTAALAQRDARIAELERPTVHAFQICDGLGAGNIGDELMARAFWDQLPEDMVLDVALFPESARQHAAYPPPHRYLPVDVLGNENRLTGWPGLLVGATPVSEAEGLHWPLQFLAPRLKHFHDRKLPVDAVGVGVDHLVSDAARALFVEAFLPIRSWTVRSMACRDALLSLGVPEKRIRVGADWAWLHTPRGDLEAWAKATWRQAGIDPSRPLLVANVVNMQWRDRNECRHNMAVALAEAAGRFDLQVAFFCNDCRSGDFFDAEAAREIMSRLPGRAALVPNLYYSPDEALALLRQADVTVGQRYHFVVASVLADTVPVIISRGQKMTVLADELGIGVAGTIDSVDRDRLLMAIGEAIEHRAKLLGRLRHVRSRLRARAGHNLDLLREAAPYAPCWPREPTEMGRLAVI